MNVNITRSTMLWEEYLSLFSDDVQSPGTDFLCLLLSVRFWSSSSIIHFQCSQHMFILKNYKTQKDQLLAMNLSLQVSTIPHKEPCTIQLERQNSGNMLTAVQRFHNITKHESYVHIVIYNGYVHHQTCKAVTSFIHNSLIKAILLKYSVLCSLSVFFLVLLNRVSQIQL